MLTKGQASCLVLDWEPTKENREKAKNYFHESPLDVTYRHDSNPLQPIAFAGEVIKKNPYVYKTYPDTPETRPGLTPAAIDDDIESITSDDTTATQAPVSCKTSLYASKYLEFLKRYKAARKDPQNTALFDHSFFTNQDIFQLLQKYFPDLDSYYTSNKLDNGSQQKKVTSWES
ncbi:hypothetical protein BJV82DRAFT_655849 [Fennellomyces sp. T-0311]|nr:hypothetical protein BJV82DRAFT_655849 [Fennellomyces sp. T-0311]